MRAHSAPRTHSRGLSLNLGFNALAESSSALAENLRNQPCDAAIISPLYAAVSKDYTQLAICLGKLA